MARGPDFREPMGRPDPMQLLYTWQGKGFDIFKGTLDRRKSIYASRRNYLHNLQALDALLGTDQYLFCYCDPAEHQYFERGKEWEWVLCMPEAEILGYLHGHDWRAYVFCCQPMPELHTARPSRAADFQAVVRFPVPVQCIVKRNAYRIRSETSAELVTVCWPAMINPVGA